MFCFLLLPKVILQKMLQVFEKRISSNNVSHYVQVVYNCLEYIHSSLICFFIFLEIKLCIRHFRAKQVFKIHE